jgi:hypothetical protein
MEQMLIIVFWIVMLCGLVGGCQHFGGTYGLHHHVNIGNHPEDNMALQRRVP